MVLVIYGFWLWDDLTVVLGAVNLLMLTVVCQNVLQIEICSISRATGGMHHSLFTNLDLNKTVVW